MRIIILILLLLLNNCTKYKTVLICGDHICVNKEEADQYFEENLSIEVQIIDRKEKDDVDLVELNLNENIKGIREVKIFSKKETGQNLKKLTNNEKNELKKKIKNKKKKKEIARKITKKKNMLKKKEIKDEYKKDRKIVKEKINKDNINLKRGNIVDVCSQVEKCNIDAISKYLIDQGKKRDFPDITKRQ